jgi:iron complex transport system permease protein
MKLVLPSREKLALRPLAVRTALIMLLISTCFLAVGLGALPIAPPQVLAILAKPLGIALPWSFDGQQESVLLAIRLPRLLLGILVGAALAASGAAMQGLFRNPLADPGLIGVSGGAAFAAVLAIVFGFGAISLAAFGGGLATTWLVYGLANRQGQTGVATLLLAGIAINALAGAGTGLLTFVATDAQLRNITFWSLGSLGGATWENLLAVAPFLVVALGGFPFLARSLNVILLGEAEARHLGVSVETLKRSVIVLVALGVGASVSVCGTIGFVALVVPHLLRMLEGPDHRHLLIDAELLGACLLLGADVIARTLVAPAELPIGIVTAAVGAPFFLGLLLRSDRGSWN